MSIVLNSTHLESEEMSTSGRSIFLWISLTLFVAMGRSEVFYRKNGQEMIMDCGAADENLGIEWKHNNARIVKLTIRGISSKGNSPLAQRTKLIGNKLKIFSVEISDFGLYSCIGKDASKREITIKHTLNVITVSVSPSNAVLTSTDVTLKCEISGDSKAQVQWMRPPGSEPYGSPGNTVTLNSVTLADAGKWTCQVKDIMGHVVQKIEEDIHVVGLLSSEEIKAPVGGDVELTCFLPDLGGMRIVEGGWKREGSTDLHFPTLSRRSDDLRWNRVQGSRVKFTDGQLSTNFTVTLNNVQPSDSGLYVCTLTFESGKKLSTKVNLVVEVSKAKSGSSPIGKENTDHPSGGDQEVTAPLGGTTNLPCSHSPSSGQRIVGGGWTRDPPTDTRLPVLTRSEKGLRWNGTNVLESKVTFSDTELSTNFGLTLNNVELTDAGVYICTLIFEDGKNWTTMLSLVEEGGILVARDMKPPSMKDEFWHRPVLLGLALWIWVAVGAGSLLLIVLIIVCISIQCRKKQNKKIPSSYAQEYAKTQDELAAKKTKPRSRSGMQKRPLPPVPKNQYEAVNR
ncbi:roundabout homolog 2-like isoform X2 [Hoplias malabaricus]|uniref:roundabout homolog 2-like isoform X2 n=1 Tax=Hoplias malabaricus TaxID=27720 RepID=UPI003462CDBD